MKKPACTHKQELRKHIIVMISKVLLTNINAVLCSMKNISTEKGNKATLSEEDRKVVCS